MSAEPSAAVAAAIAGSSLVVNPGALERARGLLAEWRDLKMDEERLAADLGEKRKRLLAIVTKELVDIFDEVGIRGLDLAAAGNLPAVVAVIKPFYRANIAADWDAERREAAFAALTEAGGGDLIKRTFTVEFGRGEAEQKNAERFRAALAKANYTFTEQLAVPWNTLTAFVREMIEKRRQVPPLEALGATVGRVADVKFPTVETATRRK